MHSNFPSLIYCYYLNLCIYVCRMEDMHLMHVYSWCTLYGQIIQCSHLFITLSMFHIHLLQIMISNLFALSLESSWLKLLLMPFLMFGLWGVKNKVVSDFFTSTANSKSQPLPLFFFNDFSWSVIPWKTMYCIFFVELTCILSIFTCVLIFITNI